MEKKSDWSDFANCKGHTDDFYAIDTPKARRGKAKIMIAIISFCGPCRVSSECLIYACKTNQQYGVWATFTPRQISAISKEQISPVSARILVQENIKQIKETYNVG